MFLLFRAIRLNGQFEGRLMLFSNLINILEKANVPLSIQSQRLIAKNYAAQNTQAEAFLKVKNII